MNSVDRIREWRHNPCKFAVDNFGITLDHWQEEALTAIGGESRPRRRVAMKACTGPGKSAILAIAGWHRLSCFANGTNFPKGVALSGEGRDNLRDNLWTELLKWQNKSPFLKQQFDWNKSQITQVSNPDWFLSARSYAQNADSEAVGRSLSGLHSEFPFILLDETGQMPLTVGQKAEQIFTGGVVDGLIMQAGNPTSTSGLLYHTCSKGRDNTIIITITADPDDPKRTSRVDINHAREMISKYGKDNAWVMATILGLFPPGGLNSLLSLEEVETSMKRNVPKETYEFAQKRLGVDVARFGDDRTIIFPRQGLQAFNFVEMRNARTNDIAARVIMAKQKWQSEVEFVDGTGGYGAGVIDSMLQGGYSPLEIHFSGKAIDPRYYNKRTEMWFGAAEWIKRGGGLPYHDKLIQELIAPTYTFKSGKMLLEPKDQIKDRIGFSPDIADALCLTFAHPDAPGRTELDYYKERFGKQINKTRHEWDPVDDSSDVGAGKTSHEWDPI